MSEFGDCQKCPVLIDALARHTAATAGRAATTEQAFMVNDLAGSENVFVFDTTGIPKDAFFDSLRQLSLCEIDAYDIEIKRTELVLDAARNICKKPIKSRVSSEGLTLIMTACTSPAAKAAYQGKSEPVFVERSYDDR